MSLEHRTIAVVEDDPIMGESLVERLSIEGARVVWWRTLEAARGGIDAARADLMVCDMRLPDGTGEELFQATAARQDAPPFLFVTAYADIDQAVRLMRSGAGDYMTKPFDMNTFLTRLEHLLPPLQPSPSVLGTSKQAQSLERLIQRIAPLSSPVLFAGETGSGKEVCAKLLHALKPAPAGPFMAVNCAAIPTNLLESELFGHEKGAFTGAASRHLGYAERAAQGVLFLDEIGELDQKLQAKLLRLIEEKTFHRVGGERPLPFQARLICATNADLEKRVVEGTFRQDLLYRINILTVEVPPLRERAEDILWLTDRFFIELAGARGPDIRGLSASAVDALRTHPWLGNVRELRNRVERAIALSPGPWLLPRDLFPEKLQRNPSQSAAFESLEAVREEAEKRQILRALQQSGGAVISAATALGISRTTMWEKMRRYGIEADQPA